MQGEGVCERNLKRIYAIFINFLYGAISKWVRSDFPVKGPYSENPTHAYLLPILQIKRYYPNLGERYSVIMAAERELRKKVLTGAFHTGEINPTNNLDTVAAIFNPSTTDALSKLRSQWISFRIISERK